MPPTQLYRCNLTNVFSKTLLDVDDGTRVYGWEWNSARGSNPHQNWKVYQAFGSDQILIFNEHTNKYIKSNGPCQKVSLTEDIKDPAARWRMEKVVLFPKVSDSVLLREVELNVFRFESVLHPSCVLDLAGGSAANGADVLAYTDLKGANQWWIITTV
ncbi:ricin B lectin domain-containing protein [Trichoderma austrokoningii]